MTTQLNAGEEIVLKFNTKTGEATVETKGFKGGKCADASKFLKETLGTMTKDVLKQEFYEKNTELENVVQSNYCG